MPDDSAAPVRKVRLTPRSSSSSGGVEGRSLQVRPHTTPEQQRALKCIKQIVQNSDDLLEICDQIEPHVLAVLGAECMGIYQKDRRRNELVSLFRSSAPAKALRLKIGTTSIGGFVALQARPLRVRDVYDREELQQIHEHLVFDDARDNEEGLLTESILCMPIISHHTLLGVFEVLNKRPTGHFSRMDETHAYTIAQLLGDKFHFEMKASRSAYDGLIDQKLISPELLRQLEEEAEEQRLPLAVLLTRKAGLAAKDIGASLEEYYMVPFMPYDEEMEPNAAIIEQLNSQWLAASCWVPFTDPDGQTIILIDDPNDSQRILEIQQLLDATIYDVRVGLPQDILRYLGEDPREHFPIEQPLDRLAAERDGVQYAQEEVAEEELLTENESTIITYVNQLIVEAVERDASDIHLHPGKGRAPGQIRLRVDGVCREFAELPAAIYGAVVARIKILSNLDIAEKRRPQDGKIAVTLNQEPLELRVAIVPTVNGESAILRILAAGEPLPFDKLNFLPHNRAFIEEALAHPHGLVLVVGPTGSGKTTTLHGLLGRLNTPERHILTAEDPVEITQAGLQQVQVQPKIGMTFANALRAFLRADPDVILIGEMRDQETAHAGIEASLTGHLVLSTLHTNSAAETVVRLLDMGLDPINFADALIAVVAQRLVRTLCKRCKEEYTPDAAELERLSYLYGPEEWAELELDPAEIRLHRLLGCSACMGTGYKGRTGVHEVLTATKAQRELIANRGTVAEIARQGRRDGMRSLMQDGIHKILMGQTDLVQLRRVTVE